MPANTIIPKKSLGQNFLVDKNISRKIISELGISASDIVLEIGPGTGALTELILETGAHLTAIEIDPRAVELLDEKFPKKLFPFFNLVHSDIRDFDISSIVKDEKIHSIGNIPYYISADILFQLFENAEYMQNTIIMVQKEVAKRVVSQPNSKDYGILGIAAGMVADCKIAFDVPPTCFFPRPKVTSAILNIKYNNHLPSGVEFKSIIKMVKAAFSQRRKTLRNSLKQYLDSLQNFNKEAFLAKYDVILQRRAETLSIAEFIEMYQDIQRLIETN